MRDENIRVKNAGPAYLNHSLKTAYVTKYSLS